MSGTIIACREPIMERREPMIALREPIMACRESIMACREPIMACRESIIAHREPTIERRELIIARRKALEGPLLGKQLRHRGKPSPVPLSPRCSPGTSVLFHTAHDATADAEHATRRFPWTVF